MPVWLALWQSSPQQQPALALHELMSLTTSAEIPEHPKDSPLVKWDSLQSIHTIDPIISPNGGWARRAFRNSLISIYVTAKRYKHGPQTISRKQQEVSGRIGYNSHQVVIWCPLGRAVACLGCEEGGRRKYIVNSTIYLWLTAAFASFFS